MQALQAAGAGVRGGGGRARRVGRPAGQGGRHEGEGAGRPVQHPRVARPQDVQEGPRLRVQRPQGEGEHHHLHEGAVRVAVGAEGPHARPHQQHGQAGHHRGRLLQGQERPLRRVHRGRQRDAGQVQVHAHLRGVDRGELQGAAGVGGRLPPGDLLVALREQDARAEQEVGHLQGDHPLCAQEQRAARRVPHQEERLQVHGAPPRRRLLRRELLARAQGGHPVRPGQGARRGQGVCRLQPQVCRQQRGRVRGRDKEPRLRGLGRGRQRRLLHGEAEVPHESCQRIRDGGSQRLHRWFTNWKGTLFSWM